MTPFYSIESRLEGLERECKSWLKTPFHKGSRAKGPGGGVDCVSLVQEIYFSEGVIPEKHPLPEYKIDWHKHNANSLLEDFIETYYKNCFLVLESDAPVLVGDLLGLIPKGKCIHHAGVVHRPGMFVHAMQRRGVIESHMNGSTYGLELGRIFRPIEQ